MDEVVPASLATPAGRSWRPAAGGPGRRHRKSRCRQRRCASRSRRRRSSTCARSRAVHPGQRQVTGRAALRSWPDASRLPSGGSRLLRSMIEKDPLSTSSHGSARSRVHSRVNSAALQVGSAQSTLRIPPVAATLRHDTVWYDVNARSARHFLLLGAIMVVLELALPRSLRNEILGIVAVVGLAVATIINWRYSESTGSAGASNRVPAVWVPSNTPAARGDGIQSQTDCSAQKLGAI